MKGQCIFFSCCVANDGSMRRLVPSQSGAREIAREPYQKIESYTGLQSTSDHLLQDLGFDFQRAFFEIVVYCHARTVSEET